MFTSLDSTAQIPEGRARDAVYAFAHTMLEAGRLADAIAAFRVLVRFAPTDERSWLGLGLCHERLEQDEIAGEVYGAGTVASEPKSARCYLALARIVRRRGDGDETHELVEEAAAIADSTQDEAVLTLVAYERSRS